MYLETPAEVQSFPEGERVDLLRRLIPGVRVEQPSMWAVENLHREEVAEEYVTAVRAFISGLQASTRLLTIMFTDIVDSTVRAVELGDERWSRLLVAHHALVRKELARHQGHEVDTAGDGFMATFESPQSALRCARAIHEGVSELGVELRIGLHTGECEMSGEKPSGAAVHAAARIAAAAQPGEVLVSSALVGVAGAEASFGPPRSTVLKGLPGEWDLLPVTPSSNDAP